MQKLTRVAGKAVTARPVPHKPGRARPVKPAAKPAKPALQPTITRVEGNLDLSAPHGCIASVLLKLVDRDDGHRYYAWWAMAGRHDADTYAIHYKHNGEDVLRFDLPDGMALSAEALQPHLESFLGSENNEPSDPPVIRG
jgi:hypothetical protein